MNLSTFKRKLLKPCKKVLHLFKFKLHKKVFLKALQFRHHHRKPRVKKTTTNEGCFPKIQSVFHSLRRTREVDRVTELKSFSDAGHFKAPYSSPITPSYIRSSGATRKEVPYQDVEDACKSFENYLIEMIIEDGKMRDLVDVEELLYCWKNLTCPVFTDLVCRFYGELCKDLFSNSTENEKKHPRRV